MISKTNTLCSDSTVTSCKFKACPFNKFAIRFCHRKNYVATKFVLYFYINYFLWLQRHCRLKHSGDVRVVIGGKNGAPEKIEIEDHLDETDDMKQEELYRCVHCPYVTKSIQDIENHTQNHMTKQETDLKCCFCSYLAYQKFELYNHLKLHDVTDPEDYINKSVPYKVVYPENMQMYIKKFQCTSCPYITDNKSQFLYHKQFHKLRGATYKCRYCSYNVSKRHLLQQHLRLHNDDGVLREVKTEGVPQIETQMLKDCPLVWVSKEGKFTKMFKCRFCPHLNVRKVNIQEHEKMHCEHEDCSSTADEVSYSCPDCSYTCNNAGVLSAHFKVHQGINGQIHCLVDATKSDEEQINELMNKTENNFITVDDNIENFEVDDDENDTTIEITDIDPEKILFFCQQCPARYLFEKELEAHIRFHGSRLFYRCDYCSYTARQRPHLLTHCNVHTQEYQMETKNLQSEYLTSKNHLQPYVSIVDGAVINNQQVWTVVETSAVQPQETTKETNKKFACTKCPTKFYNNESLAYHMTLHGGKHPYKCHTCDYSAITRNNLEKHEKIHTKAVPEEKPTSPIPITIGNVQVAPGSRLYQQILDVKKQNDQNIIKTEPKTKRYKCLKCPSSFEKREQFKVHSSLHGSNQRYRCDKCDYSVKYYANYVQHVKKHDNEIALSIEEEIIDDPVESEEPKLAMKSLNSKPGALKLTLADRQALMILQEIRNNNNNMKDVSMDDRKLFWCPHCPYTSHRRDAVDNHVNRHISVSGIRRNYTCEHCDYTVPQSHFLREHTNIHFAPMKYHQPDGYLMGDIKKISSGKSDDEDVFFEECENEDAPDDKLYKPIIEPSPDPQSDTKILIDPKTLEIADDDTETKDDDKSSS